MWLVAALANNVLARVFGLKCLYPPLKHVRENPDG